MKKEPVSQTNKWVNKIFFPRLLVSTIWRYVFKDTKQRIHSETAAKITHGLSITYVLIASTFAGYVYWRWTTSGKSNDPESTALFYSKYTKMKNLDKPDAQVLHYSIDLGSIKKEDITETVRELKFGKYDETYDKYADPEYLRKRLKIKEGSAADESFDPELAGIYLRRIDKANDISLPKKKEQ